MNIITDNVTYGFKNGSPVNDKQFYFLKDILKECINGIKFTKDFIEETFNPIIHLLTNNIISTSMDQFEYFCKSNNLYFKYDLVTDTIFIKKNKDIYF